MPTEHANLSPSSAERWISCPASVGLINALPKKDDDGSKYAREGTLAHALAEIRAGLKFGLISDAQYADELMSWKAEFDAEGYEEGTEEEMYHHTTAFLNVIEERLDEYPNSTLLLEQRMDAGVPDCWGTSDVVIVSPEHVEIIDLKYGSGVPVSAVGNPQLRLYALGAFDTFGDLLGEPRVVHISVFQPRVRDGWSTEVLPVEDLLAWRAEVAIPAAEEALYSDNPKFGPSEEACRWCPLAGVCRARLEKVTREDFGDPLDDEEYLAPDPEKAPLLGPADLARLLPKLPEIRAWVSAVEAAALEMAYSQGTEIPGWKVIRSGGKRSIVDPNQAIETLKANGFTEDQILDTKLKAMGTIEKMLGKKRFEALISPYVSKSAGRESLVPESDHRPAITPGSEAADDFAE